MKPGKWQFIKWAFVFTALLAAAAAWGGEPSGTLNLTAEEKAWLKKEGPKLVAAHITDYESASQGTIDSYCEIADQYIEEIEKIIGVTFKKKSFSDFRSIMEEAQKGSIDIIPLIEKENKPYPFLNFTAPYFETPAVIVARKKSLPGDLKTLKDLKVGVSGSYRMFNSLRTAYPQAHTVPEEILSEALRKVADKKLDVVIGGRLPVTQTMKRLRMRNLTIAATIPYQCSIRMASVSRKPLLGTILNKAVVSVPQETKKRIVKLWGKNYRQKSPDPYTWFWFLLASAATATLLFIGGSQLITKLFGGQDIPMSRNRLFLAAGTFLLLTSGLTILIFTGNTGPPGSQKDYELTAEENAWLSQNREAFTIDAGYNIPPVAFFDGREYTGIAVDYIEALSQKTGITFKPILVSGYKDALDKIKKGEIKIIGGMQRTEEREQFFFFTKPYFSSQFIILTRASDHTTLTMENLADKAVSIPENSFLIKEIKRINPRATIIQEDSYLKVLQSLSTGRSDVAIMNQAVAFYLIEKETMPNLSVAGKTPFINHLSFAVPKQYPMVYRILNRAFESISREEREALNLYWFHPGSKKALDRRDLLQLFFIIASVVLVVMLTVLVWNLTLQKRVRSQTRQLEEELEQRKKVARELSNSRSEYRQLFLGSPVGIFFYDTGLRVLRFNDRLAKILRALPEQLRFLDMGRLKDDRIKPSLRKALSGEESLYEGPYDTTTTNITIQIRMKTAPVINEHGEIIGAVAIVEDITDQTKAAKKINEQNEQLKILNRKMEIANEDLVAANEELEAMNNELVRSHETVMESEILYRNIFEGVADGLIIFDRNYKISAVNESAMEMLGYNREEIINLSVAAVMDTGVYELSSVMDSTIRSTGKFMEIIQQFRRDGSTFPAEVRGSIIRFHGEDHILAVIRDVSERIKTEELIMQSEKMHTVGSLAAGMAHEINNPLGIIVQGIQNVERRLINDIEANREKAAELGLDFASLQTYCHERGVTRYFSGIREAGERAADIIRRLINFSTRSQTSQELTDLNEIIREALDLATKDYDLKKKYNFNSLPIEYDLDESLPPVQVIREDMEQVILHLVRNAAQFMTAKEYQPDESGPLLKIETFSEKEAVGLRISDTGPGIDRDAVQKIFDPFYTTHEVGEGTGLGLTVVYFIITGRHDGSIKVEETGPGGTTFLIRLPLEKE